MAYKRSLRRYRNGYEILLRLYSKPYHERFGEGMEQTFHDLLRERAEEGRRLFSRALWMFAETAAGIFKENITFMIKRNKNIIRLAIMTALVLLVPLLAMQFTDDVDWSVFDFVAFGALLFGSGLAYELIARRSGNSAYRAAIGMAVAAAFLLVWINGAVGIIGNEDNPVNMHVFLGDSASASSGRSLARLRPRGMSRAMFATATRPRVGLCDRDGHRSSPRFTPRKKFSMC